METFASAPPITIKHIRSVSSGVDLFFVMVRGKPIAHVLWKNEEMSIMAGVLDPEQSTEAIFAIDSFLAERQRE